MKLKWNVVFSGSDSRLGSRKLYYNICGTSSQKGYYEAILLILYTCGSIIYSMPVRWVVSRVVAAVVELCPKWVW